MSDQDTKQDQTPSGVPDVKALTDKVQDLTQKLEKATTTITGLEKAKTELEGSVGGHTKANSQLTQQVSQFKTDLETAQATVATAQAEAENWKGQFEQLNTQHAEVGGQLSTAQKELALYQTIASDPKYHNLVGMVQGIKVADTPEDQKVILDALAGGLQATQQNAIQNFQAGGTPPAATGQQPGSTGPQTKEQVFAALQSTSPVHEPQKFAALQNQLMQLQNNGQQQAA